MPIVRNSFIQMSKLTNLKGRINYISSHARQENLYAVYETTYRKFWTELAKCNQEEFKRSGTEGKCIEARELIIALPECFAALEPKALLQQFTDYFKNTYDVECISALHHNKSKTNYHIHLIFSKRKLLSSPVIKLGKNNPLSANIKRNNHSFTQVTFFHFVADKLKNIFVHNNLHSAAFGWRHK